MTPETLRELEATCSSLTAIAARVRQETNQVVGTNDPVQVITHYDKLRHVNELIKESREALSELGDAMSRDMVPSVMRAHNVKTITVEGVGRVSLSQRWSASMTDKPAGMKWLRENEHGGVIQETVNAQTLGALAKELNNAGIELPAPTFTTNVMTYTSITKAK